MRYTEKVIKRIKEKDSHQKEYIQAVEEVLNSTSLIFEKHQEYEDMAILERLVEPERIRVFDTLTLKITISNFIRAHYKGLFIWRNRKILQRFMLYMLYGCVII